MEPLCEAVIVALVLGNTAIVLMVKVADFAPAATVTDAGTVAFVELEAKVTEKPPEGAAPLIVTVPVEVFPPTTDVGESANPVSTGGLIVSDAVRLVVPKDAEIVALVALVTPEVDTVKVVDVAPEGTVTLDGRVALEVLDDRLTATPLGPAGPFRVTVPVEEAPPVTEVGDKLRPVSVGVLIVSVALSVDDATVAEIDAEVVDDTPIVVIVNVADVAPEATVTLPGTVADEDPETNVTVVPFGAAGLLNVTVPVEEEPPVTEVGESVSEDTVGGVIVNVAVWLDAPRVAVMVAEVELFTPVVVILNVAEVAPEDTVIEPGTVALEVLDAKETIDPPGPAWPLSVTVPVDDVPP